MEKNELEKYLPKLTDNNFEDYLKQLKLFPTVLFDNQIKKLSNKKLEETLQGHLRFVISVAKSYFDLNNSENLYLHLLAESRNRKYNRTTIIKNGNKGLIKAIYKYLETQYVDKKDISFASFCIWDIRNDILNHQSRATGIKRNSMAKLGNKKVVENYYITKCKELIETDMTIKNKEILPYIDKLK